MFQFPSQVPNTKCETRDQSHDEPLEIDKLDSCQRLELTNILTAAAQELMKMNSVTRALVICHFCSHCHQFNSNEDVKPFGVQYCPECQSVLDQTGRLPGIDSLIEEEEGEESDE
jgi:hypothetical protein